MLQGREVGWQRGETQDREQKDPPNCALGTGKEGRAGGWPQPLPSFSGLSQLLHIPFSTGTAPRVDSLGTVSRASSTSRETMELFCQGTAFQGQVFSGEKQYFIFFLMAEKYKS